MTLVVVITLITIIFLTLSLLTLITLIILTCAHTHMHAHTGVLVARPDLSGGSSGLFATFKLVNLDCARKVRLLEKKSDFYRKFRYIREKVKPCEKNSDSGKTVEIKFTFWRGNSGRCE
jgi:hypothetical protein